MVHGQTQASLLACLEVGHRTLQVASTLILRSGRFSASLMWDSVVVVVAVQIAGQLASPTGETESGKRDKHLLPSRL